MSPSKAGSYEELYTKSDKSEPEGLFGTHVASEKQEKNRIDLLATRPKRRESTTYQFFIVDGATSNNRRHAGISFCSRHSLQHKSQGRPLSL